MTDKIDLKKTLKSYFNASKKGWEKQTFPAFNYLMIDGQGAPGGAEYVAALEALYPAAYAVKFFSKIELERDYTVPPLEGLWWSDDLDAYVANRRDEWQWTMMIMLPDWITAEQVSAVVAAKSAKSPGLDLSGVRFAALEEGNCLQHLHLGPFSDEAPKLAALHDEIMPDRGVTFNGHHHEIYLSDPRKSAPEKLKTVLRQPVKKA